MGALDEYASHIVKPSHLDKPDYIMLYGNPGSGKSTLAASIAHVAEFSPTLIISTEGGLKGILTGYTDDQMDIIEVTTHGGFEAVFDAVLADADSGELKYKSVIIDTFDVAYERALEYFKAIEDAKPKPDGFKVWAQVGEWANKVGRGMKDAPFLGITVLHSKRTKNENGPFEDVLALSGSAKDKAHGIPDIVGFTVREKRATTLYVGSSNNRATKSRFESVLPDEIENPTMQGLFNIISPKAAPKAAPKKEEK